MLLMLLLIVIYEEIVFLVSFLSMATFIGSMVWQSLHLPAHQCNQAWEEHQFIFCHSLAVCF